ncbi:MAG TPA: PQQ-binding-like beta-propeller repeat protein [Polyangiaceae bacterium]|nr:PQQ-binding-like beta-propeller repeat protein [Polyangiaceae bacterium]
MLVALVALGCSKDAVNGPSSGGDAGGPAPAWGNQAYDVQSTWHDTNEPKLTKKNVGGLVELWSVPVGLNSTVTVVGNRVFAAAASGISALDSDSGAAIWRQSGTPEAAIGTSASPTYDDGVLYIDNGANGFIYALDARTGHVLWSKQVEMHAQSAGYSTPIVSGDRVFVGISSNEEFGTTENATFKGSVVALDKKTGEVVWQRYTAGDGENGCAVWSTVAIDPAGHTVFAATGNNYTGDPGPDSDSIFALDTETGAVKWHVQANTGDVFTVNNPRSLDSDFGANPVVFDSGKRHLLAAGEKSGDLYVFDRDDGSMVAKRAFGNGSSYIGGIFQALAWDGRYLYTVNNQTTSIGDNSEIASGDSASTAALFALDPTTLDIVWERQLPAWVWAPITLVNGMTFVGAETHLEAIDTTDGSGLFDFKAEGTIIGAPVVNDGRVYVPSGLTYYFGHPDDKLHALALPDDPAIGKKFDAGPPPDLSAPTFTNVYKAVISKSCIDAQCHGSSHQGNLDMSSQFATLSALVRIPASGTCPGADGGPSKSCGCGDSGKIRVVPGKPEESLIVEKLAGNPSCGERMPPTGDPLPGDLQNLVKNWISAGAPID